MGRNQESAPINTIVLLSVSGTAGQTIGYNFKDKSIRYFEYVLDQSFTYTLVDNIGTGSIRISYNRPSLEISTSTDGSKTLKAGDSIYIEESIWHINIYYIENSTVELILKNDKS